jgi:predicted nucleic acid-binding protein
VSDDIVISDASALIGFNRIDQIDILERLFGEVMVPPAVVREVGPSIATHAWLREQPFSRPVSADILAATLGPGETEAIALALELPPTWIVLDDRRARRFAESIGLPVIGALGIIRLAKLLGMVTHVAPLIELLQSARFFIDDRLVTQVLKEFGEG